MLEATIEQPETGDQRGHLTPAEAGEHGQRAGAGRLVLTHISEDVDEAWARGEAERDVRRAGRARTRGRRLRGLNGRSSEAR